MPGLLRTIQARARRISVPLLLVYLLLIPLLAFSHQCGDGFQAAAAGAAVVLDGSHAAHDSGDAAASGHECPACTGQRHLADAAPASLSLGAPPIVQGVALSSSASPLRPGARLRHPSRGPPLS